MFGWIDDMIEAIHDWFLDILVGTIQNLLNWTHNIFEHSVDTVYDQVTQTPDDFSPTLVSQLETITETAIMPVAGIILTYAFCYEIYILVAERNKGNEFDTASLFYLLFKTSVVIMLVTNSFTITLAFFDLGQWIANQIPQSTLSIPDEITTDITDSINEIPTALTMIILGFVSMLASFVMAGIIYVVAWSRIINIMIFVSIAPLPFATLMNNDWLGSIGQTYIKQILALMLQGYFMLICLLIYSALLEKTASLIVMQDQAVFGLLLMLVSMGILTMTLAKTHTIAKSVVGVF